MAAVFNLFIDQGADFIQDFEVEGDLAGSTITGKLRKNYLSTNGVPFTCTANLDTSTIRLELNYSETANLAAGHYVYDVNIHYTGPNTIQRVVEGIAIVNPTAAF
jgi:hypothetical protein